MFFYRIIITLFFSVVLLSCKQGAMQPITTDLITALATGGDGSETLLKSASANEDGLRNNLAASVKPEKNGIQYIGFAKDFLPVKEALKKGSFENLHDVYQLRLSIQKNNLFDPTTSELDLLGLTELADLYLLENDTKNAIKSFSRIEKAFADQEDESIVLEKSKGFFSWFSDSVIGSATFSDYDFRGFEKVLILNLKSIAYLLEGDRKAYSVTRKAIDLQGELREQFSSKIIETKDQLAKLQLDIKQQQINEKKAQQNISASKPGALNKLVDKATGFKGVLEMAKNLNQYFLSADKRGAVLPSAYVNPFGDYMNGIVQEFDSLKNPALRSNALSSYKKAAALNSRSSVIKKNISAMKSRRKIPASKRLIHFVVGDGFAPEKKVLLYNVSAATGTMPVRLPIYESDSLALARRIDIKTVSGKTRLARLSVVANIDALCLRSQKDRRAEDLLNLSATVARTFFEKEALSNFGVWGQLAGNLRDKYTEADTRSWLSLPSSLLAARMVISKSIKKVRFIAYDRKYIRIIDKIIDLPAGNGFVYARVIGKSLYLNKSNKLWIDS